MASTKPSLPVRQPTNASLTDDEAVPIEDTSTTTGLFQERLQAWKHACGYLENYVSATEKMQKAQAHEYEKVLKTIAQPLKEGHHFDQALGGVAGLFENLRANTQGIANAPYETEKNLKGSVLPILNRLHTEIKNKAKEIEKGAGKGAKAVDKARNTSQKHIELLGQHTGIFDSSGGRIDASNDPYVLQRGILHRLHKQVLEENNNRQDILAVQQSFQQFEAHVLDVLQQAMGTFLQFVGGQAERTKAMYEDMVGTAQRIPPDFEWNGFVSRNQDILVDPNSPLRSVDHISFPNQGHRSTQPLIEGTLERKSRMIGKGYNTGYYVVTPSKYLHEFRDNDNQRADPTPELSLYLPDCLIGAVDGTKFQVKGKDASKGKVGGAFATSHELAFKAHTADDARKWWEVIRSAAGQSADKPVFSESPSPVDSRQASYASQKEAVAGQHPAPINTQQPITGKNPVTNPASAEPKSAASGGAAGPYYGSPRSASGGGVMGPSPATEVRDAAYQNGNTQSGVEKAPGQY